MRYVLDTNVLSALIRSPRGAVAERIKRAGASQVYTSVVVTAELRFGVARKKSERLAQQVETIIGSISVEPWQVPYDGVYADLRLGLERAGTPIGANDLLIAAQALGWQRARDRQHERV